MRSVFRALSPSALYQQPDDLCTDASFGTGNHRTFSRASSSLLNGGKYREVLENLQHPQLPWYRWKLAHQTRIIRHHYGHFHPGYPLCPVCSNNYSLSSAIAYKRRRRHKFYTDVCPTSTVGAVAFFGIFLQILLGSCHNVDN